MGKGAGWFKEIRSLTALPCFFPVDNTFHLTHFLSMTHISRMYACLFIMLNITVWRLCFFHSEFGISVMIRDHRRESVWATVNPSVLRPSL